MQERKIPDEDAITHLGGSSDFEGDLKFYGTARIGGRFKGSILGEGTLEIGAAGKIGADIHVTHVIVHGEIRGAVTAEQAIEIKAPGRVFGDLEAPVIAIEAGAFFQGKCRTQQPEAADKTEMEMKSSVKALKDEAK